MESFMLPAAMAASSLACVNGPPVIAPNTPAGPILITSHRITPEPGGLVLLGLGATAFLWARRRNVT
ncbi:MAG: hypothetical protein CMJ18_13065 [Phycisphaeraceae bacterium]|nr:hypothetical protein [Phycisphaeraceae bacterium]